MEQKMETKKKEQFLISEAAKQVHVEAHVLRYWEEELQLPIQRNKLGQRFYTKEDLERFYRIKKWKEQGLQLRAIRNALKNPGEKLITVVEQKESTEVPEQKAAGQKKRMEVPDQKASGKKETSREVSQNVPQVLNAAEAVKEVSEDEQERKAARLQFLLTHMMKEAVQSNNEELLAGVKELVAKEIEAQFREKEERDKEREEQRMKREEEHFKRIDELLRSRSGQNAEKKKKWAALGAPH